MTECVQAQFDRIDALLLDIVADQARARGDIEWLKTNTVTRDEFKNGISLILDRFDALAGKFEDSRYGSAKNADRLDEHEKRISALETKRS